MLHQTGDVIRDRYQIVRSLGQGGMGITYEAEDLTNQQRVAVKALSLRQLSDWKAIELFEREARVLENLHHPAIPRYLEHFQIDSASDRLFYLVQEIAPGSSLAQLVQQGWHATEAEVKQIGIQVLEVLNYLHRLTPPVIHRDIKPQNIIRRDDGQIVLVDFGAVQDVYRNTLTAGGTFVGTFGYMPPEQFRGKAFFASDLYALGATLLYLLTHRSPADLPQKRMKIDFRGRVNISEEFAHWLDKMIDPVLEDRFHSAEEALNALKQKRKLPPASQPAPQLSQKPSEAAIAPYPQQGITTYRQSFLTEQGQPPKGSRILVNRTPDRLVVEIPPTGFWDDRTIKSGFVSLVMGLFLISWTFGALRGFAFLGLMLIPVWFAWWQVMQGFLFGCAGISRLEIEREWFGIGWECMGAKKKYLGNTSDIARVEVNVTAYGNSRSSHFILWEGVRPHRFGIHLLEVEQEWLVGEVSSFLNQVCSVDGKQELEEG